VHSDKTFPCARACRERAHADPGVPSARDRWPALLALGFAVLFGGTVRAQTQDAVPAQGGAAAPAPNVPAADGLPLGAAGGTDQQLYGIDDGTTDTSLGLTLGGTLCWMQRFDTRPQAEFDLLSEIQVAYGFPGFPGFCVPNGTTATVCVWEDPNDDGDPVDAILLRQQATTVQNADSHFLNPVAIPATTVERTFFVGVFLKHLQNQFPASRDTNTTSQGRAFFLGTVLPNGVFDPANLLAAAHTQIFSMDTAGTPPGSLNSVWRLRALGDSPQITTYCTPKVNSLGCTPQISHTGVPRATSFFGFVLRGTQVRNQKVGLLLYGTTGRDNLPFQGGFLCMSVPRRRSVARSSGGTALPTNDCTGVLELDMNAFAHGVYGGTPNAALLVAGNLVDCQWWGRDSGFPAPNNSSLSGGLEYPVLP